MTGDAPLLTAGDRASPLRGGAPRRYRSIGALLLDLGYVARHGHRLRRLPATVREP